VFVASIVEIPVWIKSDGLSLEYGLIAAPVMSSLFSGIISAFPSIGLPARDKRLLKFADEFEKRFVRQDRNEDRNIKEDTLDMGWKMFGAFPENELVRISPDLKKKYYKANVEKTASGGKDAPKFKKPLEGGIDEDDAKKEVA